MLGELKDLSKILTSRSDWAIVGAAAVIGYTVDLAINIAFLPGASPGVCGGIAAGSALSAKRGFESWRENGRCKKALEICQEEVIGLVEQLTAAGHTAAAQQLSFEARLAETEGSDARLREAIARARDLL